MGESSEINCAYSGHEMAARCDYGDLLLPGDI